MIDLVFSDRGTVKVLDLAHLVEREPYHGRSIILSLIPRHSDARWHEVDFDFQFGLHSI